MAPFGRSARSLHGRASLMRALLFAVRPGAFDRGEATAKIEEIEEE
jgi:hypothetical protein